MAGKSKKGCGEREEWRRKRGGRIEGKSHKKMRQQKMAGGGGGADGCDGCKTGEEAEKRRGKRITSKWSERSWREGV